MPVAKEQIRQIISENNITSVADVYSLLRDSFKDILQELMEAEMDATLGYEKNQKGALQSDNSTVNSRLMSPVTATGSLSRNWFPNTRGIFPA